MTTWQRRLRGAIAVFGIAFAILVYFAIRGADKPKPRRPVQRVDPAAAAESTAGVFRQLKGSREVLRVEYERSLAYPDGRQKLEGVRAIADQRGGRRFTVTSREGEIGQAQDVIVLKGNVQLASADGLKARTEDATYGRAEGIVRAPGAMAFAQGGMSGTSVGLTYDQNRDVLWLLDKAVVKMAAATPGDPATDVISGTAGFARRDNYARFERGFHATTGTRTLTSATATAYLTEDGAKLQMLEMRGQSRITGVGEGSGALRGMDAKDINLEFADDGRTMRGAVLAGDAVIQLGAADGADGRRISGQWIDLRLGPDGTSVVGLTVREGAKVDLPADQANPARTIGATSLTGKGEPGKGLTSATFVENVEYREVRVPQPGAAPVIRLARSQTLDLAVQPGFGSIDEAKFAGHVRFEEGQVHASAAQARYLVAKGVIELDGVEEATGQVPRVTDDQVSIEGKHVELTMEGRKVLARDDVRTMMQPAPKDDTGGKAAVHRPSMLKADQPLYATGAALDYDGGASKAIYTGGARLWQGDTAIQGEQITLDDRSGDLSASGKVRSAFLLEQQDEKTKKVQKVPTIGSASALQYEDAIRRATYTTGAHVSGPQGDLRADKIELYLKPSGDELDRVEAYTKVTLQSEARTATGDRMTYFSADERYLMLGAPVKIVADCRETIGRTLTFFKSVDRIVVDGNEETRTQTKGGGKCGEPR